MRLTSFILVSTLLVVATAQTAINCNADTCRCSNVDGDNIEGDGSHCDINCNSVHQCIRTNMICDGHDTCQVNCGPAQSCHSSSITCDTWGVCTIKAVQGQALHSSTFNCGGSMCIIDASGDAGSQKLHSSTVNCNGTPTQVICGAGQDCYGLKCNSCENNALRVDCIGSSACYAAQGSCRVNECPGQWSCPAGSARRCGSTPEECNVPTEPPTTQTPTPPPELCEWTVDPLETTGSPHLEVEMSGFNSKDVLSTYFYLPSKWGLDNVDYSDNGVAGEAVVEHGAGDADIRIGGKKGDCYNLFEINAGWGAIAPTCSRSENDAEIEYTCKVEITITEDLGDIRGEGQIRTEIFELPIVVVFPRQVDAHLDNLSVFDNLNNIAAIIYQEVDVDVNDLSVDATVRIYSSLQWPFKCDPNTVSLVSNAPGVSVVEGTHQDCADANAGDNTNGVPGDENACNQVWEIKMTPSADPRVCELDGEYGLSCTAICQPSFEALTDCPLVKDDLGLNDNTIQIDYTLDSENFCVQVVDEVDISASLASYKDYDHTVDATNFILGQTIYFVATSSSSKATIVSTVVDHISLNLGGNMPTVFDQGANSACDRSDAGDTNYVSNLVVEDGSSSGACELNVPTQANFQWLFCENGPGCPFNPPVDGQTDFDVWVTLDITFKDVDAPALLEEKNVKNIQMLQNAVDDGIQNRRATSKASLAGSDEAASGSVALSGVVAIVFGIAASVNF